MNSHRMIGPYQVLEELGRGGMGAVYRARDPRDGREVAVKVLLATSQSDERRRRRFAREVEALRRLRHPNVVEVVDAGEAGDLPWLAMRYVAGESLEARLRREGPLTVPETLRLAEDLGAALSAVHAAGVLHRDVKPANVLWDPLAGRFLLTDFGLARDVELAESRRLSRTGALQGTPGYWAPEQAASEETGPWTDVYGLGATLYAALTGQAPIQGASFMEIVRATCETPPSPLQSFRADLPAPLERAIRRSLAKAPTDRFDSVETLLRSAKALDASRPRSVITLVSVLVVLLLVAGGLLFVVVTRGPAASAPTRLANASPTSTPSTPSTPSTAPTPTGSRTESRRDTALRERMTLLLRAGKRAELFAMVEREAQAGDPEACFALGTLYVDGVGVTRSDAMALTWFRKAAAADYPPAISQLGRFHMLGLGGLPADPTKAVPLLRRAADRGVGVAMVNLGTLYMKGLGGLSADPGAARRWFERAAGAGNLTAVTRVGEMLERGIGTTAEPGAAVQWFRKSAERGDPDGAYFLGMAYEKGNGVEQDHGQALKWLTKAAELGQAKACLRLGDLYARAVRVESNPQESAGWYRKAAEAGHPRAMHVLYRLYQHGAGQGDPRRSIEWLQRAVRAGYPRALADLGWLLLRGVEGLPRDTTRGRALLRRARTLLERDARAGDPQAWVGLALLLFRVKDPQAQAQAVSYLRRAAEAQDPEGMVALAGCYARGYGVERSDRLMLGWVARASLLGHAPALERLGAAHEAGRGTPRDVNKALKWMRMSAERGWRDGMYGLGVILDRASPGRTRDGVGAVKWLTEAARRRHPKAMLHLALLHSGARGDPPDVKRAEYWLERARSKVHLEDLPDQAVLQQIEAALARLKR